MEIDEKAFPSSIEELNKIKESIIRSKDSVDGILKSISADWKSDASEQLVANLKKSMNTFQTYIDELNKIILYLQDTMAEFKKVEEANKAATENAFGNVDSNSSNTKTNNTAKANTTSKSNFDNLSKEEQNKRNKAALQAALGN